MFKLSFKYSVFIVLLKLGFSVSYVKSKSSLVHEGSPLSACLTIQNSAVYKKLKLRKEFNLDYLLYKAKLPNEDELIEYKGINVVVPKFKNKEVEKYDQYTLIKVIDESTNISILKYDLKGVDIYNLNSIYSTGALENIMLTVESTFDCKSKNEEQLYVYIRNITIFNQFLSIGPIKGEVAYYVDENKLIMLQSTHKNMKLTKVNKLPDGSVIVVKITR